MTADIVLNLEELNDILPNIVAHVRYGDLKKVQTMADGGGQITFGVGNHEITELSPLLVTSTKTGEITGAIFYRVEVEPGVLQKEDEPKRGRY